MKKAQEKSVTLNTLQEAIESKAREYARGMARQATARLNAFLNTQEAPDFSGNKVGTARVDGYRAVITIERPGFLSDTETPSERHERTYELQLGLARLVDEIHDCAFRIETARLTAEVLTKSIVALAPEVK